MSILTTDKNTEIFCITDDFCKEFSKEMGKVPQLPETDKRHRNRPCEMSDSEIITILMLYHFGSFKNFKRFYLHYICVHLRKEFSKALSYNRFIQIEYRVFIPMMFFLNTVCFGKCTGITFVDSAKIAVCNNKRICRNKVFQELAKRGKSTMGWFYGFKLHLVCNDRGELLSFCLTPGNVDDRNQKVLKVMTKKLFGKLFGDKGYISATLFDMLFNEGVHLVTGIKSNMKNRLMPLYDRIMFRRRSVIETINDELKNWLSLSSMTCCITSFPASSVNSAMTGIFCTPLFRGQQLRYQQRFPHGKFCSIRSSKLSDTVPTNIPCVRLLILLAGISESNCVEIDVDVYCRLIVIDYRFCRTFPNLSDQVLADSPTT